MSYRQKVIPMGRTKWFIGFILVCVFWGRAVGQTANYRQAERFARGGEAYLSLHSLSVEPNSVTENSDKFWFRYTTGDGLRYYLVDPKKETELIPANTGIGDAAIESQISNYNAAKLKRSKTRIT